MNDVLTVDAHQETDANEAVHPLTGECFDLSDIEAVADAWAQVKNHISALYEVKDRLDMAIIDAVDQPEDSKTAHLETGDHHFIIQFKERENWDQKTLVQAYFMLGEKAEELLNTKYTVDKRAWKRFRKTKVTADHLQQGQQLLEDARTVRQAKPYIKRK